MLFFVDDIYGLELGVHTPGGPYKDHGILGSILGPPTYLGKLQLVCTTNIYPLHRAPRGRQFLHAFGAFFRMTPHPVIVVQEEYKRSVLQSLLSVVVTIAGWGSTKGILHN